MALFPWVRALLFTIALLMIGSVNAVPPEVALQAEQATPVSDVTPPSRENPVAPN
jgi:hypothetical protein